MNEHMGKYFRAHKSVKSDFNIVQHSVPQADYDELVFDTI